MIQRTAIALLLVFLMGDIAVAQSGKWRRYSARQGITDQQSQAASVAYLASDQTPVHTPAVSNRLRIEDDFGAVAVDDQSQKARSNAPNLDPPSETNQPRTSESEADLDRAFEALVQQSREYKGAVSTAPTEARQPNSDDAPVATRVSREAQDVSKQSSAGVQFGNELPACDPDLEPTLIFEYRPRKNSKKYWEVDFTEINFLVRQNTELPAELAKNLTMNLLKSDPPVLVTLMEEKTEEVHGVVFQALGSNVWDKLRLSYNPCTGRFTGIYRSHAIRKIGPSFWKKFGASALSAAVPAAWVLGGPAAGLAASGLTMFAR